MIKNENIYTFEDFLNGDITSEKRSPLPTEHLDIKNVESIKEENVELSEESPILESTPLINDDDSKFYTLYKDKSEVFSCDIHIEGAKSDEVISRLIIESDDWTLMFPGEIQNGKCTIPIKKLNLFDDGQKGKIKLEVIAEGTIFIPWEDDFKVKMSKKVSVVLNENNKVADPKKTSVKVTLKK